MNPCFISSDQTKTTQVLCRLFIDQADLEMKSSVNADHVLWGF